MQKILTLIKIILMLKLSKLKNNEELISSFQFGEKINFNSLKINLGKENDFFLSYDNTIFEFLSPKVTLGNYEKLKWGINCDETLKEEDNTCRTKGLEMKRDSYLNTNYNYHDAEVFIYFTEKDIIKDIENKLEIQLIQEVEGNWPIHKWGILGFSPQGDLSNYFRNNFKEDISFLFYYSYNQDSIVDSFNLSFKTRIVLNPSIDKNNIFVKLDFEKENSFWVFNADFKINSTSLNFVDTDICISNSFNDLLVFDKADEVCKQIQILACDGKFGDKCIRQNSDIKKIPELIFYVGGKKFVFEVKDFVFFFDDQKMNLECRFVKPNKEIMKGCPKNSKFAIGKIFFSKLFPVLKYNKDGSSNLTFVTNYDFVKEQALFWSLVKIVFFFIILSVIILFLINRNKKDDDQFYTEI